MAKHPTKPRKKPEKRPIPKETPPGAMRKALDRPLERGGGSPGSAAGPRHAAGDIGSDVETFGLAETTRSLANPPKDEDQVDEGPPFAGPSGGAIGGTPAQLRSSERTPRRDMDAEPKEGDAAPMKNRIEPTHDGTTIRLTGDEAIEYAEKQGLTLNKHPDPITGPRVGLNIAEAQAIAADDPDLIWLDVDKEEYYTGPPTDFEPER